MLRYFPLIIILVLLLPMTAVSATDSSIRIVTAPGQNLAMGEMIVPLTGLSYLAEENLPDHDLRPGIQTPGEIHLPFLYPVRHRTDDGQAIRWLFRVPPGVLPSDAVKLSEVPIVISKDDGNYPWSIFQRTSAVQIEDVAEFSRLESVWKTRFLKQLRRRIENFEDHELELLLQLRWSGIVTDQSRWSWKRDEITRFLFSISGLNDVRDALPQKPGEVLRKSGKTVKPPEPILLPPVDSKAVIIPAEVSPLADRIPRSCWYAEWNSWEEFRAALEYLAGQFDRWSPGTWPLSGRELIDRQLQLLGVGPAEEPGLVGNVDSVALAGWDFSFQSGTSLLLVIRYNEKAVAGKQYPDRVRVFCSSDKLLRMADSTKKKGRSLRQDAAFQAARMKLAAATSETELGFVFLSDPWLTNLLSPRWQILGDRLNRIDARIRLARLLSFVQAAEEGKVTPVSLSEMKKRPLLPGDWQTWLLQDLQEKDGHLVHQTLGGLYNHPAVDGIDFDQVTEGEAAGYEEFKRRYTSRWRRMDPIALQLVRTGEHGLFRSRLYVSPISNRSEVGQMRRFVPNPKVVHQMEDADGLAMGVSVAIASHGFGGMIPVPIPLPVNLFLRLYAWDFAPTSYRSSTWRMTEWPQDEISWARAPFVVGVPTLLTAMMPGFGLRPVASDDYPGLEVIGGIPPLMATYSLFSLAVEGSGFRYLSLDPGSLLRFRDRFQGKFVPDPRPCDLRVFLDLKNGFMLRRKIWQLAVMNRSLAGWRRLNRMKRIGQLLGWWGKNATVHELDQVAAGLKKNSLKYPFQKMNKEEHLFPVDPIINDNLPESIPDQINRQARNPNWGPSVHRVFDELPSLLQQVLRMDLFVSVEEDALLFETDWRLTIPVVQAQAPGTVTTPAPVEGSGPDEPESAPVLDFDAE